MREVELLSPAGNFRTALAAFDAGADAVYCGLTDFSARAFADNFSIDDLKDILRYAHAHGKKVYVTFNTVIDEGDIDDAIEQLAMLDEVRPDALIVQDIGVARICRKHFPGLELHASTQLVAHNLEGVLAMRDLGFRRVVLSRELSLEEIRTIAQRCGDTELECFVHGALCYSISGLCLFGAMEKGRSGNRGKCPYCCRMAHEIDGVSRYPFSMKDLRLGEDVRRLAEAGVCSLKIEGRMKSEIYVASVTQYYRGILGGAADARRVTVADLETVFSRRTTKLYFEGRGGQGNARSADESPVDPDSLGHLGAEIGTVKRVTRDRDGRAWLRFHTLRALEKHDGLQFEAMADGRHLGMGIVEMRQAISRCPVFEVAAGTDVEVLIGDARPTGAAQGQPDATDLATALKPGMRIYCSMSNAVKRMFPVPSFRPSDYAGGVTVDLEVTLRPDVIACRATTAALPEACCVDIPATLTSAKNPDKTFAAVEKAFSKLGDTDYRLGRLAVSDPERLFAPMSVLNDLRRDLVERLDAARDAARREKIRRATGEDVCGPDEAGAPVRRVKVRYGQRIPAGEWDEVIVAVTPDIEGLDEMEPSANCRLALPVYTAEPEFNRLRSMVKRLFRAGFVRWEASDLATLRMLVALGVTDITADWTLYAFNANALRELTERGVRRFVASPENGRENLRFLAESGYAVEFLTQQSTPLFISLTRPAAMPPELAVYERDGLWVTTKPVPRTFEAPADASVRIDLSWDPE